MARNIPVFVTERDDVVVDHLASRGGLFGPRYWEATFRLAQDTRVCRTLRIESGSRGGITWLRYLPLAYQIRWVPERRRHRVSVFAALFPEFGRRQPADIAFDP
jgi:hypothetical protein